MPIHRTPSGGYEVSVCVRRVRLHRRMPPGTSASAAKRAESELRLAAEQPGATRVFRLPGDPPLTEAMALYIEHAKSLRSPETAVFHAARIGEWVRLYRCGQARECAAHIVADMLGHYAPATINRSLGVLKRGLRLAWERGLTREDHGAQIRRLQERNERDVYLSIAEVNEIARHASENVRAAIWIALLTGCRRGEILGMRREDMGPDAITIRAGNTKTLRTRTVPIVPALRPWLEYVPLPITTEGLKTGFQRARKSAGMEHVHFHDLRHSCATILLGLNVPLDVVRDVLGHTTIRTTERYAHALVDRQRKAMNRLGALHQRLHQPETASPRKSRKSMF